MLKTIRVAVCVLLATAMSGCALAGNDRPLTLAQLGLADRYSMAAAGEQDMTATVDRDRWWRSFGDDLLTELIERAQDASARAGIARAYVALRLRQARIDNARGYMTALGETREVARFRAEAKLVTERDALQIDADSARIAAAIPVLEAGILADAARIAVLSGDAPGTLHEQLVPPGPVPVGPQPLLLGSPSDLLTRRADLRATAARLKAGNWLGKPSAAAQASFRRAVLAAQEEVENAQTAFDGAGAHERGLADALAKADSVARLARQQYRDGLADYDALGGAEAALLAARDALAEARSARAAALIDLCLALGDEPPDQVTGR